MQIKKQLEQLYIIADQTRLHYHIQQSDNCPDPVDTKARRKAAIAQNLEELTLNLDELIKELM